MQARTAGTYSFADIERRTAGFDDVSDMLQDMSSGQFAPLHGVFVPG